MFFPARCWALVALACSVVSPLAGAQQNPQPGVPLDQVELLAFDSLDLAALAKEDADRDAAGLPWRFAIPHDLSVTPDARGTWEVLADGSAIWRLRIGAPLAHSLNLGFTEFALPTGASLLVRSSDGRQAIRPFTTDDMAEHGELWTPVLLADEIVIELRLDLADLDRYQLTLGRVGQGYRGFGAHKTDDTGYLSGSCNVDVVCSEGDDWSLDIPSVGAYSVNGFLNCTGVMLNDAQDSLRPLFLTAAHCGVNSSSDASLIVYWNYENTVCRPPFSGASGGPGNGSFAQFTSGSQHLASYSPSDFTLVEMDADPDPAWDVSYAGWTRATTDASSVVAIHHPGVEEKRISFEFDPTTTTSYLGESIPGDGTHVRVTDWDIGTTEGGSSGSPIFDPNHRVVGQLHGGFASCSSQTSDWYGRISVSWNGGGTAGTRLKDWLDPGNSGVVAVDTISLNTLCSDTGTAEFLAAAVSCEGTAAMRVVDCGLDLNDLVIETISVNVSSTSEPGGESVVLTESSPGSARFEGTVPVSAATGAGVLTVAAGDLLTVTYVDADDGMGGVNVVVTGTATVDCTPPTITGVTVTGVTAVVATVDITTDEDVTGVLRYGTSCGALGTAVSSSDGGSSLSFGLNGLQDDTTYRFELEVTDVAGNVTVDDNGGACYSFTTLPAKEYFTEEFLSSFDLDSSSITFTPAPGPDGYTACFETSVGLPTSPAGGTNLSMSDDDSQQVFLSSGQSVVLYGVSYNSVWVGSNGYVTLGQSDTDYSESLPEHFAIPRVAPMFDDFNPIDGGTIGTRQTAESLVITWLNLPQYSTGDSNTFQAELFFDGRVRIAWAGMGSTDAVCGLSDGTGLQGDFLEENLDGIDACTPLNCQADVGFGGPGTAVLEACGGDLSTGTSATLSLTGAPSNATAYLFAGLISNPTMAQGGTLVPVPPLLQLTLGTDVAGEIALHVTGGSGPFSVYVQYVIADGSQPQGFAFSNAVRLDFLP